MKNTLWVLLLISSVLIFTSCKKRLKGDNLAYEGIWYSGKTIDLLGNPAWERGNISLDLYRNGDGFYNNDTPGNQSNINGKVKISKKHLTVKFLIAKKKFDITKAPFTTANGTYMILDADTFKQFVR